MKALIVGHSAYDLITYTDDYPKENGKKVYSDIESSGGGAGVNMAYLLGKYGVETYFASCIGDDSYGNLIKKELESVNVHTEYMETAYNKKTHLAFIIAAKNTKTRTVFKINKDELFLKKNAFALDVDGVLVDAYDYGSSLSFLNNYSNKITVLNADHYDVNTCQLCKYVKYIIASQDFAQDLAGKNFNFANPNDIADIYLKVVNKYPGKNIVVTIGEHGAIYTYNNEIKIMPGLKNEVVDTTAAGDMFQSALFYGLLNGYDLEKAVTFANIVAGLSITKKGSSKSCPEMSDVINYFKQKYPDDAPHVSTKESNVEVNKQ